MIRRAVAVATGVMAVCFSVAAQQPASVKAFNRDFSLGFSEPGMFGPTRTSLLFRQGPVRPWSDGGQLASETAFANISMGLFDLFPASSSLLLRQRQQEEEWLLLMCHRKILARTERIS
jgi:hypothetical protein